MDQPYSEATLSIARLIPAKYRTVILKENYYHKAVKEFYDRDMQQLWYYWANFIEPNSPLYTYSIDDVNHSIVITNGCKKCLGDLYEKWGKIMPALVKLEQDANLLKQL